MLMQLGSFLPHVASLQKVFVFLGSLPWLVLPFVIYFVPRNPSDVSLVCVPVLPTMQFVVPSCLPTHHGVSAPSLLAFPNHCFRLALLALSAANIYVVSSASGSGLPCCFHMHLPT